MLPLGTVVRVPITPLIDHEGVVTGYGPFGTELVTNGSVRTGEVAEEPIAVVTGGKSYRHDYPSNVPSYEVVARARGLLGTKYDLLSNNCRDVVRHAHKLGYLGKVGTAILAVLAGVAVVGAVVVVAKVAKSLR